MLLFLQVVAPNTALRVIDRAIQAHGGAGNRSSQNKKKCKWHM